MAFSFRRLVGTIVHRLNPGKDTFRPSSGARVDMDPEPGFVCGQCGETHAGLPTDVGFKLPDDVWAIPQDERSSQAELSEDVCVFGERLFVRFILSIPILNRDDSFAWGVWAEVDRPTFQEYLDAWIHDRSPAQSGSGILANRLSDYEDFVLEPVTVVFGSAKQRPTLWLNPLSETSLAREQRNGMTESHYHDIVAPLGWWWLSFVDPEKPDGKRFIGVSIVEARGSDSAAESARRLGIHPGGDVKASRLPKSDVPAESFRNRLLSKVELVDAGLISV